MTRSEQRQLLSGLIARLKRGGQRQLVFDLDGTLIDNRPRTHAILCELAERWESSRPDDAKRLRDARFEEFDYSLADILRHLGVAEAHHPEALEFWKTRFFFDPAIVHDRVIDGALEFACRAHESGARLVYFTGRDLPNMALGTFQSLRDLGFPIGVPGTELVLKPSPEISDEEFKREFTPRLRASGEILACFDNEPANCNIFLELFPESETFLVDTQHFPHAPPLDPRARVIGDFSMDA